MLLKSRNSALHPALCALAVVLCVLAAYPVAEIGINDDWSYIASALSLARTGHIHYNGWGAMLLGWQLYLGALFIKLFGFSFTVVRSSILLVALLCVVLLQRIFLRFGLSPANAILATLAVTLSPLFLSLSFSFMSDIPGLFAMLFCLYMCLRAEQAATDQRTVLWLVAAALTNALAGSVRQLAWLGLLVMVPSVAWHLRARRHVLLAATISCIAGAAIVFGLMHWFKLQPFTVAEPLIPLADPYGVGRTLRQRSENIRTAAVTMLLFCLPVLFAFLPRIPSLPPRQRKLAATFIALFALAAFIEILRKKSPLALPFVGNIVGAGGIPDVFLLPGIHPETFTYPVRDLLDFAILASCTATLFCWKYLRPRFSANLAGSASNNDSFYLLVPFTAALILMTVTRIYVFDRYLLPLMVIAILYIVRSYQRLFGNLPVLTYVAIAISALVSVAATHDFFLYDRARLVAIDELRRSGLPRTQIRGGFEYDAWTQVEANGHINDSRVSIPSDAYRPMAPSSLPAECQVFGYDDTPSVAGNYVITYSLLPCYRPAPFAPVTYNTWLPPHQRQLFIQQLP